MQTSQQHLYIPLSSAYQRQILDDMKFIKLFKLVKRWINSDTGWVPGVWVYSVNCLRGNSQNLPLVVITMCLFFFQCQHFIKPVSLKAACYCPVD